MSAEEVLRESESSALSGEDFTSNVTGNRAKVEIRGKGKLKTFGAMGFVLIMLVVFAVVFSTGNMIPSAISERLIEETDVGRGDWVRSTQIIFQQAMRDGELPENTVAILNQYGVGVEKTENGEVALVIDGKTVTADNFISEVNTNDKLYNAVDQATYSRAAYYYDDAAKKVFQKIGTTRNNYTAETEFDEVMSDLMGEGSRVSVNNVAATENSEGETSYSGIRSAAKSSGSAAEFISGVGAQNVAGSTTEATLNSADALKVADTISKEQRSKLLFVGVMENISKMKGGEGSESKINEALNFLYAEHETEVVDVKTGEVKKVMGSAMDSPSLYAILSGSKVNLDAVGNYSSDRILKTVENKLGDANGSGAITGTVASADSGIEGAIGRFLNLGEAGASIETLNTVNQTVESSLMDNSYEATRGVDAGELLAEGAVNVGKDLAKASGATPGSAEAAAEYGRLNSAVVAMDAAADRLNRSPLDVTSENTFLGSIVHKIAVASVGMRGPLLGGVKVMSSTVGSALASLTSSDSYADDAEGYVMAGINSDLCETYSTIGAVGTPQCAEVATFDTSTLDDPLNDAGFAAFVKENTTLSASGKRTINRDSVLANFILYNDERTTPLGVVDGGILNSLNSGSSSVSFASNIIKMIENFLGASEEDKRIASGAEYVNSADNSSWQKYKWAQRYVALARATESLRRYAGESSAYNNIKYFEGEENPVVAFINEYYQVARH